MSSRLKSELYREKSNTTRRREKSNAKKCQFCKSHHINICSSIQFKHWTQIDKKNVSNSIQRIPTHFRSKRAAHFFPLYFYSLLFAYYLEMPYIMSIEAEWNSTHDNFHFYSVYFTSNRYLLLIFAFIETALHSIICYSGRCCCCSLCVSGTIEKYSML